MNKKVRCPTPAALIPAALRFRLIEARAQNPLPTRLSYLTAGQVSQPLARFSLNVEHGGMI